MLMRNPWQEINLDDYENHMKLDSVLQLQVMNEMMYDQFYHYQVTSIMILGVAGGNGLNHIDTDRIDRVYGVDINNDYLKVCVNRYPELQGILVPICADLQAEDCSLPSSDLLVADLLIEYIGYDNFKKVVKCVEPDYVSCVIQLNTDSGFVSDSPYLHVFDGLHTIHNDICEHDLTDAMAEVEYSLIYKEQKPLPNGKLLLRLDYKKLL